MTSERKIVVTSLAVAFLLAFMPLPATAAVVGNTYYFTAVWLDQTISVDNEVIITETHTGSFSINVYNVTPGRDYEYTFDGMNYHDYLGPYADTQNDSVSFEDYTVNFDLNTVDDDNDDLADSYSIAVYPGFTHHAPGNMFFVNPTWTTHASDWNEGVSDANDNPSIEGDITASRSDDTGSFSFQMVVNIEQITTYYGNVTGTSTISFSASYDDDGVLSTWDLTQNIYLQNENHTIQNVINERYYRGSGPGGTFISDIGTTLMISGGILVVGVVIGALIGKRYWG